MSGSKREMITHPYNNTSQINKPVKNNNKKT